MIVGSLSENLDFEKRVAITPEVVKKYKSIGLDVHLGKNYATLMCRLIYPTSDIYANYISYKKLSNKFKSIKGISDHCKEINSETLLISFLLGATILEKHFTLDSNLEGNDHYHSCTPTSLRNAMDSIARMKILLGKEINKLPLKEEIPARIGARRGIYLNKDLNSGSILKYGDLIELRPLKGICASKINNVIGKKLSKDLKKGDYLSFDFFESN